jgi:type III restriction enzyme
MALHPEFPTDPYAILHPDIRWYPGDEMVGGMGYEMLLPPLVYKVRKAVAAWREAAYAGASPTTATLLNHWFRTEHQRPDTNGTVRPFRWYFAQREAVESAIWLYEIERARDPYALMKFDSSGRVAKGMFAEDWTRYVLKLATGAGEPAP